MVDPQTAAVAPPTPNPCLDKFPNPNTDDIYACDLQKPQARDTLVYLHHLGQVVLNPAPKFDDSCNILTPLPTDRVAMSSTVAGVTFWYNPMSDKAKKTASPTPLTNLDVRNAVALYRFASYLKSNWGVTEIHHSGIGHGSKPKDGSKPEPNCHNQGRALDFVGVKGNYAGTDYAVFVLQDWFRHKVPDLTNIPTNQAPTGPCTKAFWPPGTRRLSYRLQEDFEAAASAEGASLVTNQKFIAARLFQDIYSWAALQYQDKTETPHPPPTVETLPNNITSSSSINIVSQIGEGTHICTPDWYDSNVKSDWDGRWYEDMPKNGREAHMAHMHMQIGATKYEAP